jgi:hypothetical protein
LHADNGQERQSRRKAYSAYDAPNKETPASIGIPLYLKDTGLIEKFTANIFSTGATTYCGFVFCSPLAGI